MNATRRPRLRRIAIGLAAVLLLGACGRGTPEQSVASRGTEQGEAPVPTEVPVPAGEVTSTTTLDATTTSVPDPTTTTTTTAPTPTTSTTVKARAGDPCGNPAVTDFPLPAAGGQPAELAVDAEGVIWFTDNGTTPAIGRLAPDGTVRMFPLSAGRDPASIAIGPSGDVWFTQYAFHKIAAPSSPENPTPPPPPPGPPAIGRITPDGTMAEFAVPTAGGNGLIVPGSETLPRGIMTGPDGAMWFTESGANQIGRITADGVITEYPIPGRETEKSWPTGPVPGPDGALWFYDTYAGTLGRIDPVTKSITERPVDLPPSTSMMDMVQFWDLELGPDGGFWFTDKVKTIARVTTTGKLTRFAIAPPADGVRSMVAGPDGQLWFADQRSPALFRLTTTGVVTQLWVPPGAPKAYESLGGMALAPDGSVWVAQPWANKITRLTCRN